MEPGPHQTNMFTETTTTTYPRRQYKELPLKFFKINSDVITPTFATPGSACFDIHAYLRDGEHLRVFGGRGPISTVMNESVLISRGARVLIPTGLIFDIDSAWSLRLHARSGLALKKGLVLTNSEGIIDSDYVDPVFVMITNTGHPCVIKNGERICQAEMIVSPWYELEEIKEAPAQKTERASGFGSTGS